MNIVDILEPGDVVLDLRAPDKRRLLDDLARRCSEVAGVEPATVAGALHARELLGSTGLGAGIAIPHARIPPLARPTGLFARLRQPMDFDAIDGERVDLVFLLLMPSQAQGDHLDARACVARRLRDGRVRLALRKARTPEEAHGILCDEGAR